MNHLSSNDRDRRLEQIVAYLDGELSPAEALQVEHQLAEDDLFRQEVAGIERAWSALDILPNATVDDRFAQTTMELVVGAAREDVLEKTRALPVMRRRNLLGKLLILATAMALGVLLVLLYIFAMQLTTVAATNAGFDPMAAVWLPNGVFLLVGVWIYRTAPK